MSAGITQTTTLNVTVNAVPLDFTFANTGASAFTVLRER